MNEAIEKSGKAIDVWLEQQPFPPAMTALMNLEVLLKTRRDLLAELVALDDEFMLHLLRLRGAGPGSEGAPRDPPA